MAFRLGSLLWKIGADTKDFDKSAKTTETTTKSLGKGFSSLGSIIKGGFAVAAVAGITSVSKELISVASEAEETRNKFNVVFGDVADDAEAAGKRIKDEFKLSDKDTEKFLSQVGDITSGLGASSSEALQAAEAITSLGLDIDSFANLSGGAEQAVSALTSLFTGEREAAKALGIVINETNLKQYAEDTGKVYAELTQLEKGFLSLELATKQSTLAIGDFARSEESYANQSRIAQAALEDLKTELGKGLLPVATRITSIFGEATRAFSDYVKEINDYNTETKAAETLTGDLEDQIAGLVEKNRLLSQSLQSSLLDWQGQGFSEDQIKTNVAFYNAQIKANQELIDGLRLEEKIRSALQDEADAQAQAEAALALEQQRQREELAEYLELVEGAYAETQQGKIDAITEEIALWEMYAETAVNTAPQVQAILQMLREEYEALTQATVDNGQTTEEVNDLVIQALEDRLDRMTAIAIQERELRRAAFEFEKELSFASVALATTTFGAISSILSLYSEENKKAAIAAKAFAIAEATVNTGLAFTKTIVDGGPFPLNLINAAAVLASGTAQVVRIATTPIPSFADGGIVPGNSFAGDNVLTRQNSGEMNINRADQQTLFNAIKSGNLGNGAQEINVYIGTKKVATELVSAINNGQGGVINSRVVK